MATVARVEVAAALAARPFLRQSTSSRAGQVYSFRGFSSLSARASGSDIEAEKLFERGMAVSPNLRWADVVNPDPSSAQRYAGLAPAVPIRWYPRLDSFQRRGPSTRAVDSVGSTQ